MQAYTGMWRVFSRVLSRNSVGLFIDRRVKYLTVYKLCALGPFDRGEEFMDAENCFDLCSWTKPLAATKKKWHQTNWLAIAMKQTCTSFLFLFFFLCLDESPEHGHRIAITWINGSGNHSQSISRLIKLTRQKGVRMSASSSVFFFLNIFCCFIEFHLSVLRHTHQTNRSYTTYTWIRKFNSV